MAQTDPIRADFRNFLFLVWRHLNLPDPTPVQYDIAHYLQHGPRRKVIEAFRGVGKSWITSAYVCWVLLNDPQKNILVVSASKERSDAFSTFTKRLIGEMPILAHLRPRAGQRDSNIAFDVGPARASHAPSVKSVGITGQLTGSRADEIVSDDVETPGNSATQVQRDKIADLIKEYDAVLKPDGKVTYLGTPQTEMSIYNLLPDRGYEIRVWPARAPSDIDRYQGRLAPYVLDLIARGAQERDPLDPQRFGDIDLIEREASYGRSGFALQFMLDTTLSDAERYPLKLADLIVTSVDHEMAPVKQVWTNGPEHIVNDLPNVGFTGDRFHRPMWAAPEMAPFTGSVMAIDPSGRGKDETGYAVVKMLHGQLYVTAAGGLAGGYEEAVLKALALIAAQQKVNHIIVEANFGDGMFTQLLKPALMKVHPCMVEEVKHSQQKEKRICDVLEPVMNQHRLIIDHKVVKKDHESTPDLKYQLMYQMTRITREKGALVQDDRLDALAMAVQYWVDQMARDTDKAADAHLERLRDLELETFMRAVVGHAPVSDRWMTV